MAKASINIKPCKAGSEAHNMREKKPDYLIPEMEGAYKSILIDPRPLAEVRADLERNYIAHHPTRKGFDRQTEPIREAVINLDEQKFKSIFPNRLNYTEVFELLHELNRKLEEKYKIKALQIHIHSDEGHKTAEGWLKINHHAHVVFAWQDPDTGKSIKLNRSDMSAIQTLCAETLGMERGKVNSSAERLEHSEYREQMKRLDDNIEQKKNVLIGIEREITEVEKQITETDLRPRVWEEEIEEKKGKKRGFRM
jgi:uncharacterized protein YukE